MNNEFVTYGFALALDKLGYPFDGTCLGFYCERVKDNVIEHRAWGKYEWDTCGHTGRWTQTQQEAPTIQSVFKWLRDNYNLKHDIPDHCGEKFYFEITDMSGAIPKHDIKIFITRKKDWREIEFNTYEEAEKKCLEMIIYLIKEFKIKQNDAKIK